MFSSARQLRIPAAFACIVGALWMAGAWRQERRLDQANAALSSGRPADAARLAGNQRGIRVGPRAARTEAGARLALGNVTGARHALRRALHDAPNDWTLHRDQAVLLLRSGARAAARRAIAQALALNPRMTLPAGFTGPGVTQP